MFEVLANGQVLKTIEIISDNQPGGKAIIQEPYTTSEKIALTPDKTTATLGETVNVVLQWQLFDLQQGRHFNDPANIVPFKVSVAGEVAEIAPVDGVATIKFSSTTPGEFEIRTTNPSVDNVSIKVVVS